MDRLTERMPDGNYRLRRDLDFWELARRVGEMEQRVQKLEHENSILRQVVQQRGPRLRDWNAQKMTAGKMGASEAVKA